MSSSPRSPKPRRYDYAVELHVAELQRNWPQVKRVLRKLARRAAELGQRYSFHAQPGETLAEHVNRIAKELVP
jgi:hypothetical protein